MSRKKPGIHSEFSERILLTVRAPEGDSKRAVQMQELVQVLTERKESGLLREWVIEALLDRMTRDKIVDVWPEHAVAVHERPMAQRPAPRSIPEKTDVPIEHVNERIEPAEQPVVERVNEPVKRPISPGLRVM